MGIIDDMVEIQRLRMLGIPDWKIRQIANEMVSNWEWLF